MPIIKMDNIKRADLQRNPSWLFVFGDNIVQRGFGGQAAEMRGEPNAVGIPTKRRPSMDDGAFLDNADFDEVGPLICAAFRRLNIHLMGGGTVVMPEKGIGTGYALLNEKAPVIWGYLQMCLAGMEVVENVVDEPNGPLIHILSSIFSWPEQKGSI